MLYYYKDDKKSKYKRVRRMIEGYYENYFSVGEKKEYQFLDNNKINVKTFYDNKGVCTIYFNDGSILYGYMSEENHRLGIWI